MSGRKVVHEALTSSINGRNDLDEKTIQSKEHQSETISRFSKAVEQFIAGWATNKPVTATLKPFSS